MHEPGTTADALLDSDHGGHSDLRDGRRRALARPRVAARRVRRGERIAAITSPGRNRPSVPSPTTSERRVADLDVPRQVATALYYGPTPVPEAIVRCEALLRGPRNDQPGEPTSTVYPRRPRRAARRLRRGTRSDRQRLARPIDELGQRTVATTYGAALLGRRRAARADPASAAEEALRRALRRAGAHAQTSVISRAGRAILPRRCIVQDRFDDCRRMDPSRQALTRLDRRSRRADDVASRSSRRFTPVTGRSKSQRELAREAARFAEASDGLNRRARVTASLGEVLRLAGSGG